MGRRGRIVIVMVLYRGRVVVMELVVGERRPGLNLAMGGGWKGMDVEDLHDIAQQTIITIVCRFKENSVRRRYDLLSTIFMSDNSWRIWCRL